jgi:DNA-binding CsgD family transcriptional regulator
MAWIHPTLMILAYSVGLIALGIEGVIAARRRDPGLRAFLLFHVIYTCKIVLSGLVVAGTAGWIQGFRLPLWFQVADWIVFGLMFASLAAFFIRSGIGSRSKSKTTAPDSRGRGFLRGAAFLLLAPNVLLWLTPWVFSPRIDHALFPAFPLTYFAVTVAAVIAAFKEQPAGEERRARLATFAAAYDLSRRELEVIDRLLDGRSNATIAEELYVSIHTVKRHMYNIFKKTGATSRLDLIRRIEHSK